MLHVVEVGFASVEVVLILPAIVTAVTVRGVKMREAGTISG